MDHFTLIDEATLENEQISSNRQENALNHAAAVPEKDSSLRQKKSIFLQRYLEKHNGVRIFIDTIEPGR